MRRATSVRSNPHSSPTRSPQPYSTSSTASSRRRSAAGSSSVLRRRLVEQHVHLGAAQHPGQPALARRCAERPGRIGLDGADVAEPGEVAPQRRSLAGDAPRRVPPRVEVGQVAPEEQPIDRAGLVPARARRPHHEPLQVAAVGRDGVGGDVRERRCELGEAPRHEPEGSDRSSLAPGTDALEPGSGPGQPPRRLQPTERHRDLRQGPAGAQHDRVQGERIAPEQLQEGAIGRVGLRTAIRAGGGVPAGTRARGPRSRRARRPPAARRPPGGGWSPRRPGCAPTPAPPSP